MERLIAASLATALILGNLGCTPTSAHVSAAATPATSPVKPATSKPAMDAPLSDGIIVSGPVTVEQQLDVVAHRRRHPRRGGQCVRPPVGGRRALGCGREGDDPGPRLTAGVAPVVVG